MGEGVLKKHIYLWTINIEYSCRETFFQVYTLRLGVSSKIRDKRQGGGVGNDYTGFYYREKLLEAIQNQKEI